MRHLKIALSVSVILLFAIGLAGCESQVAIHVTCKDAVTREPLADVQVNVNAGMNGDYTKSTAEGKTDANGNFATSIMIGCPGKCYDIYITYTKEGYTTKKELNVTDGEVLLDRR